MAATDRITTQAIDSSMTGIHSVQQLFEYQAASNPEKIALIHCDQKLSYGELNRLATVLACQLLTKGIQCDSFVGVHIDRSLDLIISMLAIIKSGAAYLPLDTNYPIERIDFMLTDSRASTVITSAARQNKIRNNNQILVIEDCLANNEQPPTTNLCVSTREDDLIYANYTSGSTGQPKGVAITHRSVLHLLQNPTFVKLNSDTVMLQLAPAAFDAFTFELWGPLLHGGKCILHHESLPTLQGIRDAINDHGVTLMFITTSLFHLIIDEDLDLLSPLRQLVVGGETLSIKHIRKALTALPTVEIINAYGPTECTTFSTTHPIQEQDCLLPSIPIGRPINNALIYILNDQYQQVHHNVIGDIYIAGPGLAREYLNAPELTDKKFISNLPFLKPGERIYQTGDLGRVLPNGDIEFIGRADDQVKIHGFRVELGEIETTLNNHPQIKQAIVAVDDSTPDTKKLVAYLIPETEPIKNEIINSFLREKLPRYMIPSQYTWLQSTPLKENGKLDRKRIITAKGRI